MNPIRRILGAASQPVFAFAFCFLSGFLIYAPALGGSLIWDDLYLVRENPFFRSPIFGLEVFRHYLFFDSFSIYYRPVQNWSYMVDYWMWRGAPFGYHLTNIILHCGCGFLLYLLLRRVFTLLLERSPHATAAGGSNEMALFTAVIWTVHPVHNAAVAYISGRADSLAALFALAAWLVSFRAFEARSLMAGISWAFLASLFLLLALCSKEIALVWILLFLLFHAMLRPRLPLWRQAGLLAVVICVVGIYEVLRSLPGRRVAMEGGASTTWLERPLLMLRALGDYASLMFWPGRLYMERSLSDPGMYRSGAVWMSHIRYEYLSVLGLLALCAAVGLCARRWPERRLRIFGAAWFFLAFLPISNLVPLNAEVAEHWIYLASIGFLIFLVGCVSGISLRRQPLIAVLATVAIVLLGARTWIRAGDWINAETFCARTIADGGATPRILSALASVYAERGDLKKQEIILRKMIERFPEYAPARIGLGICLSRQGRVSEAEPLLKAGNAESAKLSRSYARTWPVALNLAQLRKKENKTDEAIAILKDAEGHFPETWELVKYESELRREAEGGAAALPAVERYAASHWWHTDSWVTLAGLRFGNGDPAGAIAGLRHASQLDIYDGKPLSSIAEIELSQGEASSALESELSAMDRSPDQPRQYVVLAEILEKLGRKTEAEAALRKARDLGIALKAGS